MKGKTMFEKPRKKKVKWHGQTVVLPFDCSVYQDKTVKIKNRFSGETGAGCVLSYDTKTGRLAASDHIFDDEEF